MSRPISNQVQCTVHNLFYCLFDLRCGDCNVISLCVLCCSVNGSVCFVCCLGVVVILLFSVVGGVLLDRPCMVFQRVCVSSVIPVCV